MKIYKETIVSVAIVLVCAFALPTVAASADDCCNEANDGGVGKLTGTIEVKDVASHILKISVLEDSDVEDDGNILLGGTAEEMTVTLATWVFDRNGEDDISFDGTVKVLHGGQELTWPVTSSIPADTVTMDGFKLFHHAFTVPATAAAGVYDIELTATGLSQPFTSQIAVYETVDWRITGAVVDFGSIFPDARDITSTGIELANLGTTAFDVGIHMEPLKLVGGSHEIPVAQNLRVQVDEGSGFSAGQLLDTEGHAAGLVELVAEEKDGVVTEDVATLRFVLEDPTNGATNNILPKGVYQSEFCVLITAVGTGDFAYKEQSASSHDYDDKALADSSWERADALGPSGPDGMGSLTPPAGY